MQNFTIPQPAIIRNELRAGDFGAIVFLHGVLYAQEQGFDTTFEAYVAEPFAHYVRNPTERDRIWIVENNKMVRGCIAILQYTEKEAQLRWFILHPELRGWGLGKKLINEAIDFCREMQYESVHLWTISALHAAAALYKAAGFERVSSENRTLWGVEVEEEKYELKLREERRG